MIRRLIFISIPWMSIAPREFKFISLQMVKLLRSLPPPKKKCSWHTCNLLISYLRYFQLYNMKWYFLIIWFFFFHHSVSSDNENSSHCRLFIFVSLWECSYGKHLDNIIQFHSILSFNPHIFSRWCWFGCPSWLLSMCFYILDWIVIMFV